jgi:hypothetical protein
LRRPFGGGEAEAAGDTEHAAGDDDGDCSADANVGGTHGHGSPPVSNPWIAGCTDDGGVRASGIRSKAVGAESWP